MEKGWCRSELPVTADMLENPEDDWLATASSRARARVEVNIKKLSAEERAQFRAAQHKEMDQRISNGVISVCQKSRHCQRASHDDALGSHVESS